MTGAKGFGRQNTWGSLWHWRQGAASFLKAGRPCACPILPPDLFQTGGIFAGTFLWARSAGIRCNVSGSIALCQFLRPDKSGFDGAGHQIGQPVLAHQNIQRCGGGAVRAGHIDAQLGGIFGGTLGQGGCAKDGLTGGFHGDILGQADAFGSFGQGFDHVKDIGRTRAGDGGDHVDLVFAVDRQNRAPR